MDVEEIGSRIDVLTLDNKESNGTHEAPRLKLDDGKMMAVHSESAYENKYKDGRSFDFLENPDCRNIEFEYDFKIHSDGLKGLQHMNDEISSNPMYVYHEHVWWTYTYRIFVIQEAPNLGPLCGFEVKSTDARFLEKEIPKGAIGSNLPAKQVAPSLVRAALTLIDAVGNPLQIPIELTENGLRSTIGWAISVRQLKRMIGEEATMELACQLTIPRAYFNVMALLPARTITELASPTATMLLDKILQGEKTTQWDVVITCGEGERKDFFVHKSVLSDVSPTFGLVLQQHVSIAGCDILSVSHEERFILPTIDAENFTVLLNYIYKRKIILPRYNQFARLGRFISSNFPRDVLMGFLIEWQWLIVEDVLRAKAEKQEPAALAASCIRHLVSIYSSPYGAMPVAKRVCVSVFADLIQQADARGERKQFDEKLDEVTHLPAHMTENIVNTIKQMQLVFSAVEKRSVH